MLRTGEAVAATVLWGRGRVERVAERHCAYRISVSLSVRAYEQV